MDCASCGQSEPGGREVLRRLREAAGSALSGVREREPSPARSSATPAAPPWSHPQAGAAEARKVVTIVFADLIGSTALHERLDAESARRFMDRYYRAMRRRGRGPRRHRHAAARGRRARPSSARRAWPRTTPSAPCARRSGCSAPSASSPHEQVGAVGQTGLRVAVNTGEVVADGDQTE